MEIVRQIKEAFTSAPSNLAEIKRLLGTRKFSKEELAEIAIEFAEDCFCEYSDALDPKVETVTLETMHSNHITEAMKLLLEFGLDPNTIVQNDNVLWAIMWINAPDIAATVLKLLLENGADPNHFLPSEGETLFDYIACKVSYDEYTHEYLHTVQCWLLLMGFGARWKNGEIPLTMLNGNSVEIFQEFQSYDYEIEPLPQVPGTYGCWIMHIYDINTKEEVAVYR